MDLLLPWCLQDVRIWDVRSLFKAVFFHLHSGLQHGQGTYLGDFSRSTVPVVINALGNPR